VFARGIAAVREKFICVGKWLHLSTVDSKYLSVLSKPFIYFLSV